MPQGSRRIAASMLSPRSDISAAKVDSPSEKPEIQVFMNDDATMGGHGDVPVRLQNADEIEMSDEEAIESDDEEEPPYKRICRGRDSALSAALNEIGDDSFSKPIVIRVGPSPKTKDFHIHSSRLETSPYLSSQLSTLSPNEALELPEEDPTIFALYAHYIYNPNSISTLDLPTSLSSPLPQVYNTYIHLLHAYIFGEKLQSSDFQNEIMNRILECIGTLHSSAKPSSISPLPSTSASENIVRPLVELLYPSLPPDSIGRGLVVETFIVLWSHSDMLQGFVPEMSRELLTEIAEMLLSGDKDHIRDAWAQAVDGDYSYYHSARYDEH